MAGGPAGGATRHSFRPRPGGSTYPATLAHVDRLIDAGVHGLIMLGARSAKTLPRERREARSLAAPTVDHVAGRVPVLSGVAEYTTRLAQLLRE